MLLALVLLLQPVSGVCEADPGPLPALSAVLDPAGNPTASLDPEGQALADRQRKFGGEPAGEFGERITGLAQVCPGSQTVSGIDVSYAQGKVDWAKVKASGQAFAIQRISYGTDHTDATFTANWPAMKSAGLIRGAYQFFLPHEDPVAQAKLLSATLAASGGLSPDDLPPVLDVEVTGGLDPATLQAKVKTWLDTVKAATGRTPIVYTGGSMSAALGGGFGGYPLWVANYGVSCPSLPSGWQGWQMWQSSASGSVAGVTGNVDLDRFNGSLADLKAFIARSSGS